MLLDKDVKEKLETDPMYRLEHGIKDKQTISKSAPHLTQLQHLNSTQWSDPYTKSQQLRKQFRIEKKRTRAEAEANDKIRDKNSLQIELLPEIPSDVIGAKSVEYNTSHLLDKKRLGTAVKPLFGAEEDEKQLQDLKHIAKIHTRLKTDPFYQPNPFSSSSNKVLSATAATRLNDVKVVKPIKKKKLLRDNDDASSSGISSSLVAYTDSESD
jgi:coiled-coil domain-containing protein 130